MIWEIFTWLANTDLLSGAWNILGVLVFIMLFLFTFKKLYPKHYTRIQAILLAMSCIFTLIAFIDISQIHLYFIMDKNPNIQYLISLKAQQTFTLIVGITTLCMLLKKHLRVSYITLCSLGYVFLVNTALAVSFNYSNHRVFPEPLRTQLYIVFYIPAYTAWSLAYIYLWR